MSESFQITVVSSRSASLLLLLLMSLLLLFVSVAVVAEVSPVHFGWQTHLLYCSQRVCCLSHLSACEQPDHDWVHYSVLTLTSPDFLEVDPIQSSRITGCWLWWQTGMKIVVTSSFSVIFEFLKGCRWRFKSSKMLYRVRGQLVFSDVQKKRRSEDGAFICRVKQCDKLTGRHGITSQKV